LPKDAVGALVQSRYNFKSKGQNFNKIVKKLLDFHIQVEYTFSQNGVVMKKWLAYQSVIALIKVLQKSAFTEL